MNGTDVELRKELWMWRGVLILALAILTMVAVFTYLKDRDQHASDNSERATHWQKIESNQTQIMSMIDGNKELVGAVDEHLRQCSGCHSHPKIDPSSFPPFTGRKERLP